MEENLKGKEAERMEGPNNYLNPIEVYQRAQTYTREGAKNLPEDPEAWKETTEEALQALITAGETDLETASAIYTEICRRIDFYKAHFM